MLCLSHTRGNLKKMESILSLLGENRKSHHQTMTRSDWYPVCFIKKDYQAWKYYQRWASEVCSVCDDCTDEYQKKMKKENRCFMGECMELSSNSRKYAK